MKKIIFLFCFLLMLTGCKNESEISDAKDNSGAVENSVSSVSSAENGLKKTESLNLEYANQFSVDYYEKGYIHISVSDGTDYIVVPENEIENSLGLENPVYIHKPCDRIYLAASSAMDLFLELGEMDSIVACSTKASDYSMDEVKDAINSGDITYVGKYSMPDYEQLLTENCSLAIESTMINHSPKIKEQLERINIPVFIERSSYEENPIGRLEWIKLYGILTGKEKEAEAFFESEVERVNKSVEKIKNTDSYNKKNVAFFSITSTGYVTVRKPGDYICRMIEMAGGEYALNDLLMEEENALSTVNIGMEDFYKEAHDADILIYNGSIDGGVNSVPDLLNKNELLKEFKAVKEGMVWSTGLNMFQQSSKIADVIVEMSGVINESSEGTYLKHLE